MGKPGVLVIKQSENASKSRSTKHLQKRLGMLERRMEQFIEERNTWEEKNKVLSDALNTEKLLTASLKKESFHWQRLYHETAISNNTYKMKMFKIAQSLTTYLREFDSMYPHMVAFTGSITTTKLNLKELLSSLPTADYSVLAKRIIEGGGINCDNRNTEKPMKHKVGPMVKGLQIVTKPKIMIERLMLPQNREQIVHDDNVDDLSPNDNPLPAIPEEHEDPCFRHLPVRLKRSKLGTSWRQRRKENLNTEATQERKRNTSAPVSCNEDSSESEDIPAVIQHVTNISRRVKGPLLSKVGSIRGVEEESGSLQSAARHFPMSTEDPMEGSSWMYGNYHPPHSKERRSSIYKSESSDDDEDALTVPKKATNMSIMNTLVMDNQSFNDSTRNISKSKSESCSSSSSCTPEEPDSTNNVESPINKTLPTKESKLSCSLSSTSSPGVSTDYGTSHSTLEQQLSKTHSRLSVCLSKVPSSTPRLSSDCGNRFSEVSLSNSPTQSFVTSRKRVRQPNNRKYPSEDYVVANVIKTNNSKIAKLAIEKKSRKSKTTELRNSNKRLSSRSSDVVENSSNGCGKENSKDNSEDTQNKTKRLSKARPSKKSISKPKPSITNAPQQVQGNVVDSEDKGSKAKVSKAKQRLSKKSACAAPKSSINESQHLQNIESENRLSRRNKNNVCYKESPINLKKRRP